MQKLMTGMKKKEGYIAIETIIVAGLIIGLGALSIAAFQSASNNVTTTALTKVSDVQSNYGAIVGPGTTKP